MATNINNILTHDVLPLVFAYAVDDLPAIACVCQEWKEISQDPTLVGLRLQMNPEQKIRMQDDYQLNLQLMIEGLRSELKPSTIISTDQEGVANHQGRIYCLSSEGILSCQNPNNPQQNCDIVDTNGENARVYELVGSEKSSESDVVAVFLESRCIMMNLQNHRKVQRPLLERLSKQGEPLVKIELEGNSCFNLYIKSGKKIQWINYIEFPGPFIRERQAVAAPRRRKRDVILNAASRALAWFRP